MTETLVLEPEAEVVKAEPLDLHYNFATNSMESADDLPHWLQYRDFMLDPAYKLSVRQKNKKEYNTHFMDWEVQPIGQSNGRARFENLGHVLKAGTPNAHYIELDSTFYTVIFMEGTFHASQVIEDAKNPTFFKAFIMREKRNPSLTMRFHIPVCIELGHFSIALDDLESARDCLFYILKHSSTLRRKDVLTLVEKGGNVVAKMINAAYTKATKS